MRICRLDAFLQGYDVKFLEFNADSPAGVGYTDILYEGLRTTIDLPRVRQEFDTAYTQILPELIAHPAATPTRTCGPPAPTCRRARGSRSSTPTARPASPSSASSAPPPRRPGSSADHATLDEVTYDGTTLRVKDEPVHLVYRRALLEDLDQSDLVAAARDGRICLVNPFRSPRRQQQEAVRAVPGSRASPTSIEGDEADVIRETIPWTRILRPGRVTYGRLDASTSCRSSPTTARSWCSSRRRTSAATASRSGWRRPQEEWERIIAAHADRADYIVQEYVPVPEEMFPTVEDGHVQMRLKRFNINPFGIGGRYAGSITRISDRAVINVSAGGGLLPSVIGRHKRRLLAEDDDESEVLDGQKP